MVRETRHLWVGNLPENIREDRIREHFKRYGRVQSVKLLPRSAEDKAGGGGASAGGEGGAMACTVAFMDIKSASKAHNSELKIDDRLLNTEYYEPAAIPSQGVSSASSSSLLSSSSAAQAASSTTSPTQQAASSPYSTSPAAGTRFPNGHGSSDDLHLPSFYDRSSSRVSGSAASSSDDFLRRGYHGDSASSNSRRSSRDRNAYRTTNGPPFLSESVGGGRGVTGGRSASSNSSSANTGVGSSSSAALATATGTTTVSGPSVSASWSSYESTRYNSTGSSSQTTDTGYSTTPTETNERRTSDQQASSKKKAVKSRSGSKSPPPSGSTSSRSPSRSRSRSSSSSSSSSTSRDTSSTTCGGSPKSARRLTSSSSAGGNVSSSTAAATNHHHQPVVHSDDRRPLAICVRNLPTRSSDTSLKDGLFHEYKKHGKVTWVKVVGQNSERHAIVCFKKPEDVEKALEVSYDKLFFGCKIEVAPYQGYDVEDNDLRPYEAEIDEYHPKATRTLFIGNLEKDVTASELRKHFDQFGEIIEIDIKKQGAVSSYAFCQYTDIVSVVKAIRKMDGEHLANNRVKLGFGKSMAYNCVWVDGVHESVNEKYLRMHFEPFGVINKVHLDRDKGQALIFYEQVLNAQAAVNKMRGFVLKNSKVQVDFASRECQESFFERLEKQGGGATGVAAAAAADRERALFDERPRSFDASTGRFSRSIQSAMDPTVPFAPPDIRNLQKERVHLLEQLEECPSSGDELMSPKKRLKLDLLDSASDVIIEANRDHRKVVEVRRLSEVTLKHHSSRRPSIDAGSKHSTSRDLRHDVAYLPHAVCKRRKTASSDGSRIHHYDHSGSESVGGSRPGTPLCDEKPENFPPSEPRRVLGREREGPLTLPLPRFAAQVMNRGSVSVAGIKGQQKDNPLSSPPPTVTSPRISNLPRPPSPVSAVPPPASPPPRPPSLSSNSSDSSDLTPPSPSLEERIRSLDEKYEKWSGSRALSAAGGDALALLDANLEKFRQRHKLLDLDLKEVQPSEIVKSVMAKRSVFDEDLKRLENVGEKYEPKEFSLYPRVGGAGGTGSAAQPTTAQTAVPAAAPSSTAPPVLKLAAPPVVALQQPAPKTPVVLSPRSSGTTSLPAAKGLQYPFPTHPPISALMSPVPPQTPPAVPAATPPVAAPTPPAAAAAVVVVAPPQTSLVVAIAALVTSAPGAARPAAGHGENRLKSCAAGSDNRTSSKVNVNRNVLPVPPTPPAAKNCEKTTSGVETNAFNKTVRENKSSEKVSTRRDSSSCSTSSPRAADVKTRRNSDSGSARRSDEDGAQSEERKKERFEKIRLEKEKSEKERAEKELVEREKRESELERERLEKERLEQERLDRELLERAILEKEQAEKDRLEQQRQEKERKAKEEEERRKSEQQERERKEHEERKRREQEERERREKSEHEKKERDERERRDEQERKKEDQERGGVVVRHKEDNHHKHREIHSETKHRDNNLATKEDKVHESGGRKESHRHHADKECERRKDSVKENRDNNVHDKHKILSDSNSRNAIESRHAELEKSKSLDSSKQDNNSKRRERNNSLPEGLGSKRRLSSHETPTDNPEESKKVKLGHGHEHKKLSERRDSKDGGARSEERAKGYKHKNNVKSHDRHNSSKDHDDDAKRREKEREERHRRHKLEKQKSKSKSREKDGAAHDGTVLSKSPLTDKDFLAKLELRSTEDIEKQRKDKLRSKENVVCEDKEAKRLDSKQLTRERQEKPPAPQGEKQKTQLSENEASAKSPADERRKRDRPRKLTNSTDSDSDEPKKHSIFDIVDDEPAYISMYDKVKARSCKNMAKLEEEKRQEKIKAKFSQLKQSRAKREEKKRSTSWDEDSDSENPSETKIKRCPKMLIDSSDDESQERRSRKKKDIYSDSDSSAMSRPIKQEPLDTSEDEAKQKHLIIKSFKSLIPSDSASESDYKRKLQAEIKSEVLDAEIPERREFVGNIEEKLQALKAKEELGCLVKKERRNSKLQDSLEISLLQVLGDDSKPDKEKFNSTRQHSLIENTSDEEAHELSKKERREKKHKKKQKKQKHSLSSEEKMGDELAQAEGADKSKHHEKKKEHSKKEKRRDKTREGRDKPKKSKRSKSENKSEGACGKREGKMENIFGSLSDISENGAKELEPQDPKPPATVSETTQPPAIYSNDCDAAEHEVKVKEKSERERDREEHKRKKERKRREKERRLQEAAAAAAAAVASNENSMDFADMGKQLEENMLRDDSLDAPEQLHKEIETTSADTFKFTDVSESSSKKDKEERREGKEKKKKRKKSKEEKSKHHHHHHHHDKSKTKLSEKKELCTTEEAKAKIGETKTPDPSLPNLLDDNVPVKTENAGSVPPAPETVPKEKKWDKIITGFGAEIDEKLHESAVKSISEFEVVKKEEIVQGEEECPADKTAEEEKPRVVISQEETEDAVAALLGESFGGGADKFEDCYDEEINSSGDQTSALTEETNIQDDEEMRQAVQSLSSADLDVKPETPQSEHELQIDTDTEEQEDPAPLRFDQAPKMPEPLEYFQSTPEEKPAAAAAKPPNIGSPPSLTPIKPHSAAAVVEVTKVLELETKSLPLLPEQNTISVISQSWSVEKKQPEPAPPEPTPAVKQPEVKSTPVLPDTPNIIMPPSGRQFPTPPLLKLSEPILYPPLQPISKPDPLNLSPSAEPVPKVVAAVPPNSPNPSQLHNLPARSPVQISAKAAASVHESGMLSPKLTPSLIHNRLPITPVMAAKPLQAATVILQQSKVAHPSEPPKPVVSTSDHRPQQERPRMVFQTSTIQPPQFGNFPVAQPRMLIQGNVRHLPQPGLLVPTRQLPPPPPTHAYGYLGLAPIFKENTPTFAVDKKPAVEEQMKTPQPLPTGFSLGHNPSLSLQQPLTIPKELPKPPNPSSLPSPNAAVTSPGPKPSTSTSPNPKPLNITIPPQSPKSTLAMPSPKLVNTPTSPGPKVSTPVAVNLPLPAAVEAVTTPGGAKTEPVVKEEPSKIDSPNLRPLEIPAQELKSIPSPVISSAPKEEVVEKVLPSSTEGETKVIEPPVKLAIEKVTDELNKTLDDEMMAIKESEEEVKPTADKKEEEEPKIEIKEEPVAEKPEPNKENVTVIKEIEKFDEEQAETESVISDISKERSSADILAKDDPLDTKEDSDYWSAKEVNIDSVIKTLCSADELSDHSSSENGGKDDCWFDTNKPVDEPKPEPGKKKESPEKKEASIDEIKSQPEPPEKIPEQEQQQETISLRSQTRGRSVRGRGRGRSRGSVERGGIQTRRGKLNKEQPPPPPATPPAPSKRGRGGKTKPERKASSKSEIESAPADVYEFRDEPDDANKEQQRPRLILTIKSPAVSSSNCTAQTTAIVKEVTKDGAKEIGREMPPPVRCAEKAEFAPPAVITNTRKSRRLQEKDVSRNTVDDTIEDVVKNTIQTRPSSNQRRSTRQTASAPKQQPVPHTESSRKSPRGRKSRRGSEATETSSSEETPKEEARQPTPPKETAKPKETEVHPQTIVEQKDKPIESLKAAVLRRAKSEIPHEPTKLIDPVTGELIPMRECEEGKYIPLPGSKLTAEPKIETPVTKEAVPVSEPLDAKPEVAKVQTSVITQSQPVNVVQQPKPQSFKTHILASQAAQVAQMSNAAQQQLSPVQKSTLQVSSAIPQALMGLKTVSQATVPSTTAPKSISTAPVTKSLTPAVISKSITPIIASRAVTSVVSKPITPISQHLNINTNLGLSAVTSSHLSPRPTVTIKTVPKQLVKPPVLSPVLVQKQQQLLQQAAKQQQQQMAKAHLATPMVNTQLAHMKNQPVLKQQQQVIMGKVPGNIMKPTHLHQQQILAATAVPSAPMSKSQASLANQSRNMQVLAGAKGVMDPPKVDVSLANVMLGQRGSKLSPQGHQRLAGMPVPGYEASLGEAIAHFPPGPIRPPPDLNPAHYMHASHVMQYQQFLRQQQLHLTRTGGLEKDGQEGEEAPDTSPPLELRRPGSVGLALSGRGAAVPHSLHSPHDRATDSPQVGQVYNVHSARMQHYHPNRYYDQSEPPPAHRPMTSHGSLAALGSDRGLAHITPMGTPDRPLSGHSALSAHMAGLATPDRPISAHMGGVVSSTTPDSRPLSGHMDRPLSAHGLVNAGLGAAGNLMGAVARHIGAEAPTSQRGLQAATPPHASQVPPQAESLFMLLKQYPCMWQGLLALKNDQAAVQMYFVSGNDDVAKCSLPKNTDGSTPPLRIFQRMRLEPPQVEGVARKMQMENEHCMLLALPCGHDHMDVLKQSTNLTNGFIRYLQHKQAAGIVNVAAPGTTQPPAYVVHIFPSCDFVNENLRRIAPSLLERVADIAHLLIVITTV